jgi:hypothetical protein
VDNLKTARINAAMLLLANLSKEVNVPMEMIAAAWIAKFAVMEQYATHLLEFVIIR